MPVSSRPALWRKLLQGLAMFRRAEWLALLPAVTLIGFWLGGERGLLILALGLPLVLALSAPVLNRLPALPGEESSLGHAIAAMDRILPDMADDGHSTACLILQFDDLQVILTRHGRAAQAEVVSLSLDRIRGALRVGDMVTRLQGDSVAIVLSPVRRLDLESMVEMCIRLQEALALPVPLGGAQIYVTASVGFCIAGRAPEASGRALLDAAQMAADEALRSGPGAIRAFSSDMALRHATRDALRQDLEVALEKGQIRPHFQPQIAVVSGELSGLEALARWHHPERGVLAPADFLPMVESNDMFDRLGETMLRQSLAALAVWDGMGLHVPSVAVNFSAAELRNPRLPDRIRRELDRFGLEPARLTVEILETVIAEMANDVLVSNIAELAKMGCGIDLDDFGTGHASISTIRRFAVRRLKIDRSFISHVDVDREQQKMIAAIVSLADRLGLGTVAEGVENPAEGAMLQQLGCSTAQGFGIARPMPQDETMLWIKAHLSRPERTPRIGLRAR